MSGDKTLLIDIETGFWSLSTFLLGDHYHLPLQCQFYTKLAKPKITGIVHPVNIVKGSCVLLDIRGLSWLIKPCGSLPD